MKIIIIIILTALMTEWSKALPLTARCLSSQSMFESWPGHVRQLPVTWGKLGLQLACHSTAYNTRHDLTWS